jgi:hypothetical protein
MIGPTVKRIVHEMYLREPQADALTKFARLVSLVDLAQMEQGRVKRLLETGSLYSTEEYARLTFALATGVGKTRLMGAMAAYLFLEGQSRHFVLLAPSSAIFTKLKNEAITTHPKYLFKGLTGFPFPYLIHADNFSAYHPEQTQLIPTPVLFILTPGQIRPRSGSEAERRLRRASEAFGPSFVDYLAGLPDVVVFLDEGHRYGQDTATTRAWAQAIVDIKPKLVIEMTATPSNPNTVVYRYDLREALREGRYIKNVVALVEQRQAAVTDEEWDRHTLIEAMKRLEVKKVAMAAYRQNQPDAPMVKPVLLVVCRDAQYHAPQIEAFLQSPACFDGAYQGKVLRVDSTRPEDEWLPHLLKVEEPNNPFEIIVNVGMLKEGWDVTNVYVIAPLRAMTGETLTTQTIGRGLRLPFGTRLGNDELDTLDVLAFGRETVQQIIEQAHQVGIFARSGIDSGQVRLHQVTPLHNLIIKVPNIALHVVTPPSLVGWTAIRHVEIDLLRAANIAKVEAVSGKTTIAGETLEIDVPDPPKRLGQLLCREISEIGGQETEATRIFREYFGNGGCVTADQQKKALHLHGAQIYKDVYDQIEALIQQSPTQYKQAGPEFQDFVFTSVAYSVPQIAGIVEQSLALLPQDKSKAITGWLRSLYPDNRFDTIGELTIARILDSTENITWTRNPVRQFGLYTQVGWHYPDFLIIFVQGYVLLEIKNRDELNDTNSEAYRKGQATTQWCNLANQMGEMSWEYWLIPHDLVSQCITLDDIKAKRFIFLPFPHQ